MMTETFDPYQKWLGIPPDQQPPHPYRLLGVEPFEPDAEVIERAADRQMAYLRTFQSGEHADACRRLLSEIASARYSLLDEQQRAAIDRRLRAQVAAQPPRSFPGRASQVSDAAASLPGGGRGESRSSAGPTKGTGRSRNRSLPTAKPIGGTGTTPIPVGPATPGSARPLPVAGSSASSPAGLPSTPADPASGLPSASSAARRQRAAQRSRKTGIELAKVVAGGAIGTVLGLAILWFAFHRQWQQLVSSGGPATRPEATAEPDPVRTAPRDRETPRPSKNDPFEPLSADQLARYAPSPPAPRPDWLASDDPEVYGVREVPTYTAEDLAEALEAAKTATPVTERLFGNDSSLTPDERKRLARQVHARFCELAEVVTFSDFGQAAIQDRLATLERILRQIGDSPQKINAMGYVANERWSEAEYAGTGILLAGTIESVRAEPRLYRTQVRLAGGGQTRIAVYSWKDPALFCKAGDTVLVLGRVVDRPADKLAGYDGSESRVVWGGYLLTP